MIVLNQSMMKMQNYTNWVQIVLLFILKLKRLIMKLQMMLKKYLIHQIVKLIGHYQKVKITKSNWINER